MSDSPIPELDTPAALKRFAGALWRAALAAAAQPAPAQRDALTAAYHTYNVTVREALRTAGDSIDAGDRREALRILNELVRPSAHCNGAELQRYAEALQPQLERIAELVAPAMKPGAADTDAPLNRTEQAIVAALRTLQPQKGEALAIAIKRNCNGYIKGLLSGLVKRGILTISRDGYSLAKS